MDITYIYILTDSNRRCLHVGMAGDLSHATAAYKELRDLFFDSDTYATRLVYYEAFPTEEAALFRFNELSGYTRMQKERLIRRHNPNWIDLLPTKPIRLARRDRLGTAVASRRKSIV